MKNHFYHNIQGWFDYPDIYTAMVQMAPANEESRFVEVGTWLGRSAAFLAVEIANSGKKIKLDCVDSWEGTGLPGEYEPHKSTIESGLLEAFLVNMKPVDGLYTIERGLSHEVANRYRNKSIDFLFLDAGHSYEAIIADLRAWLPKLKDGAWIAGHDFFNAPDGVGRAVKETFAKFETCGSCWYSRIGSNDYSTLIGRLKVYHRANDTVGKRMARLIDKVRRRLIFTSA